MPTVALEILFIIVLIVINGLFTMVEIAVVSARKTRLQQLADEGDAGARAALQLMHAPNRFLSTIQIGITLIGILAGTFGGATFVEKLAARLSQIQFLAPYSETISIVIVVLGITYLSLVIGELVPKQLALNSAERIASAVAPPMQMLSVIASPVVRLLSFSTGVVVRALGIRPTSEPPITEEEIKIMIEAGTQVGVFEPTEQEMVERVFRLGDRKVSALMTPRTEIAWFDLDDSAEEIQRKLTASGHSRFPIAQGSLDNVLGVVHARDLLARNLVGQPIDLRATLHPPLFVPEGMPALMVLDRFKEARSQIALVIDEYGGLQGLVTINDMLEAIVGDILLMNEVDEPEAIQREDGSWLLDGMLPIDEFKEVFPIQELPAEKEGYYQTLGGFVMSALGRIPATGDHFDWGGLRFEVVDMDRRRVDKVLVVPVGKDFS